MKTRKYKSKFNKWMESHQYTEREAWLYLAKVWSRSELWAGAYIVKLYGDHCYGLCNCIQQLHDNHGDISYDVAHSMYDAIESETEKQLGEDTSELAGYLWPTTLFGSKQRVKFCLAQARRLRSSK